MPDLRPGVLFDVDGTLLDTNYLHVLAWWQAFMDAGHGPVPMDRIHRAIGIPSEGLVRH
jgi:phosphoglycolate phosphatase-like HAD superfamily hydrolase